MTNNTPNKEKAEKTILITTLGWTLVSFFVATLITNIPNTIKDIETINSNEPESTFTIMVAILIGIIFAITPLLLSLGILYRKNWCRIGIMIICITGIGTNMYSSYMTKAFYPNQILWVLFYLFVFTVLNTAKYKNEFYNIK